MDGELIREGGSPRLRFTRRMPHSAERVWRALTEPDDLAAWFPQRIEGEWKPGASLRFGGGDGTGVPDFEGEVIACEPPTLLEYRWGTDTLRFEIAPDGDACILTLIDTFEEYGKAARDGTGWHVCLDVLEYTLAGTEPPWKSREHWWELNPDYVAKFGPEASTLAPPPGY